MVMVAFSFAHEDSKKRDSNYNAFTFPGNENKISASEFNSYNLGADLFIHDKKNLPFY